MLAHDSNKRATSSEVVEQLTAKCAEIKQVLYLLLTTAVYICIGLLYMASVPK